MTIEKPNHIEPQKFRSVREAGYAEEDVDLYVKAITESYNRLLDAHYEAQVRADEATARATAAEGQLAGLTSQLEEANNQVASLAQSNSQLQTELTTSNGKLEFAVQEIERLRRDNEEALANVSTLMGQVNAQTAAAAADRVSIEEAADQAASLLRRAEEIAAEHITTAERQAEGIVGKAKQEISFLESSIKELKDEKDVILSRLRDFFAYEVQHIDEMIDRYNTPDSEVQHELESLNAASPEATPAYEEAEDAYYSDKAEEFIADQQYGQALHQEQYTQAPEQYTTPEQQYAPVAPQQYEQQYAPTPETTTPQYDVNPVETVAYEAQSPVEYIEPVEQQVFAPVEEDYAPPVEVQQPVQNYTPEGGYENFSPENFPPVAGVAGETVVPEVAPVKKKRSFRDMIGRGENN